MSDTEITAPKQRRVIGTPFPKGVSSNPAGRPKGSRNKLADQFVFDLSNVWAEHGVAALERCATEEPAQFVRVIASLMPKDVNLNLGINVGDFADRFAAASQLLGQDVPQVRQPKQLRVVEHKKRETIDVR